MTAWRSAAVNSPTATSIPASWLIGADGSHSAVRKLLVFELQRQGADGLFALGDGALEGPLPPDEMIYCYNAGGATGPRALR